MSFTSGLFGTHVSVGANEFIVRALAEILVPEGDPEVSYVGSSVAVDQDVLWLDVSMD